MGALFLRRGGGGGSTFPLEQISRGGWGEAFFSGADFHRGVGAIFGGRFRGGHFSRGGGADFRGSMGCRWPDTIFGLPCTLSARR